MAAAAGLPSRQSTFYGHVISTRQNEAVADPGVVLADARLERLGDAHRAVAMVAGVAAHLPVEAMVAAHGTGGHPLDIGAHFRVALAATDAADELAGDVILRGEIHLGQVGNEDLADGFFREAKHGRIKKGTGCARA